jgi:hypothetical protein
MISILMGTKMAIFGLYRVLTKILCSPYLHRVPFPIGDSHNLIVARFQVWRQFDARCGKQEESRGEIMTKKMTFQAVAVAGVFALCAMFAGTAGAAPASQHVTLTGYVSCTTCVMPNACKGQTRLSCTQWGISQGASYVLVVGNNHYRLSGFDKELAKAAAENSVIVTGDLNGTDVTVTNVEPAHQTK